MDFNAYDIGLVPLIVILVEVVKSFGVPGRFLPLVNIALGEVTAFVFVSPDDAKYAVLAGLVMAFSAMGLWSGAKNAMGK